MASNPIQRKTRNSFLLGMIVTLLITGVVMVILFLQLKKKTDELNQELNAKVMVYTLTQDVKSGQELTIDMFEMKQINRDAIPSNATATASVIDTWYLQTKDGKMLNTDSKGLYIYEPDSIIEVTQENDKKYKYIDGEDVEVSSSDEIIQDEEGAFIVDTANKNDQITRVYQEILTGEYYIYKLDNSTMSTGSNKTRVKEYLEIKNVPVIAKVAMNANTVITPNLVVQSDEALTDDTRQQEYNMVLLPIDLMTNDYVDIRLMTPAGQDFIVLSKTKVEVPVNADGTYITDTIRVNLREDEILAMSSAIVEAYGLQGSKLYAIKYVEAGVQERAIPTYTPNTAVTAQIQSDPNIVDIAKEELAARYSSSAKTMRNDYLQSLINGSEDYIKNIQGNIEEKAANSVTARQKYLESLNY